MNNSGYFLTLLCPVILLLKRRKPSPAKMLGSAFSNGDAGSRTRVRLLIHRDLYVRIQPFCSPRPLIGRPEAHREPAVEVSPAPSRRRTRASPILATPGGPPQAGLTARWEVRSPEGRLLTQPERSCRSQVTFPGGFTSAPSTSARSHGFTVRVETCHPQNHDCQSTPVI